MNILVPLSFLFLIILHMIENKNLLIILIFIATIEFLPRVIHHLTNLIKYTKRFILVESFIFILIILSASSYFRALFIINNKLFILLNVELFELRFM